MRAILTLLICVLAIIPEPQAAANTSILSADIDTLLSEWNRADTPGAAVLLTDGPRIVIERYYGMADLENHVPVTPATRFELASLSKMFTAFGVLLLAQQGRLALDDDIRRYLPEISGQGATITIRHLLNHTSGLSEYLRMLPYMGVTAIDRTTVRELLTMLAHLEGPDFAPGSKWRYSNTNYALLAEIVARVTQAPFGEWMSEHVFLRLEMTSSSFPLNGAEFIPDRANAYTRRDGRMIRSLVEGFQMPGQAHAFSTIQDMAKWIENLRTGRIGGRDLIQQMRTQGKLTNGEEIFYGCGLGMSEYRGLTCLGHSGSTGGFKSELCYFPDVEIGVVVLANDSRVRADKLARSIVDLYLAARLAPVEEPNQNVESHDEPRPFITLEPAALDRFVGSYRLDGDPSAIVSIAREGAGLAGILHGVGMDFFFPLADAEFENNLRNTRITFIAGDDGRPARARVVLKGEEMWATRVFLEKDPRRLEEYVGVYYSEEWGTVYEVVREQEEFQILHRWLEARPLQEVAVDRLAGGLGSLTFFRNGDGAIAGFIFEEPEDMPGRAVEFRKIEWGG